MKVHRLKRAVQIFVFSLEIDLIPEVIMLPLKQELRISNFRLELEETINCYASYRVHGNGSKDPEGEPPIKMK